jgi:hypothetical protein
MGQIPQDRGMRSPDLEADSSGSAGVSTAAPLALEGAGQDHSAETSEPIEGMVVLAGAPARCGRWRRRPAPSFPPPTGCRRVVLPFYGFVLDADDDHRERVDRFFQVPMLVLSLLVLPLLAGQYYFRHRLSHPWIPYLLEAAFLLVSVAFLVEFAIKVTIARSRWRYALKNWLDIVIIVLPFLRPFRAARVLRVAQLLPAYSFRGVYGKFVRSGAAVIASLRFVRRLRERFAPAEASSQVAPDYSAWSKAALIAEIRRLQDQLRELRSKPS